MNYITVSTTFSKKEDASNLADIIVGERLAACCHITGPIISTYWWLDKMETNEEWLCSFKTSLKLYPEIENIVKKIHPYKLPQLIYENINGGSEEYLEWLNKEIKK